MLDRSAEKRFFGIQITKLRSSTITKVAQILLQSCAKFIAKLRRYYYKVARVLHFCAERSNEK